MTEAPNAIENRMETLKVGAAGRETMNYEVRVVDEQDRIVPAGVAGEIVMRPKKPGITVLGLLQDARGDDHGVPQPVVPHRRPRALRRGRLPLLPRPDEGLDPPPRREHLVLGGRGHGQRLPVGARGGRVRRAVGAVRGRGDDLRRPARGTPSRPRSCSSTASTTSPTSRCRATSGSSRSCPRPRRSGSRSTSCARRASRPTRGTARSTVSSSAASRSVPRSTACSCSPR